MSPVVSALSVGMLKFHAKTSNLHAFRRASAMAAIGSPSVLRQRQQDKDEEVAIKARASNTSRTAFDATTSAVGSSSCCNGAGGGGAGSSSSGSGNDQCHAGDNDEDEGFGFAGMRKQPKIPLAATGEVAVRVQQPGKRARKAPGLLTSVPRRRGSVMDQQVEQSKHRIVQTGEADVEAVRERQRRREEEDQSKALAGKIQGKLLRAASDGDHEACRALCAQGAMPDHADKNGTTVFHIAAKCGHVEVVLALIEAGADDEVHDKKGRSPLHVAAQHGRGEVLNALVDIGADVGEAADKGWNSLMFAAHGNHAYAIGVLLAADSDLLDAKDDDGLTAVEIARRRNAKEAEEVLHSALYARTVRTKQQQDQEETRKKEARDRRSVRRASMGEGGGGGGGGEDGSRLSRFLGVQQTVTRFTQRAWRSAPSLTAMRKTISDRFTTTAVRNH